MLEHAKARPDAPALREKEYGIWQTLSWAELRELVGAHRDGLLEGLVVLGGEANHVVAGGEPVGHEVGVVADLHRVLALAPRSGAVMCPACSRGSHGRWP